MCKVPLVNPEIVYREDIDEWAILFDPDTAETYGLDETSSFIIFLICSASSGFESDNTSTVFEALSNRPAAIIRISTSLILFKNRVDNLVSRLKISFAIPLIMGLYSFAL